MIRKIKWIIPLVFFAACNDNEKTATGKTQPGNEHAGHHIASHASYCDSINNGLIAEDTLKGSPSRKATATINEAEISITYNSPGVKGRTVWGGLVPYDKVWVTGAHKATSVQFSKDVEIDGKKIPAGKYAFFTIPAKAQWIVIFNTRTDQHLADDYAEKEDVLRTQVTPTEHAMTPRLTYLINKINDRSGEIVMQWEQMIVKVPFVVL